MKFRKTLAAMSLFVLAATCIVSCDDDDDQNTPPTNTADVRLQTNEKLGKILTDAQGRTLYSFALDVSGQSACSGDCIAKWPVFYKADPSLETGLDPKDFGVITRADGAKQSTYKGWPLYYFQNDAKAGDIKGDSVGGTWFTAKPDYSVALGKAQLIGKDGVKYTGKYVAGEELTEFITDAYGRTLYQFSKDSFNINKYTKADFSNDAVWPIYQQTAVQNIPTILKKADFGVIDVFGKKQLAYRGWALYFFGDDESKRGNTKGVSVPTPGIWPINNNGTLTAPKK